MTDLETYNYDNFLKLLKFYKDSAESVEGEVETEKESLEQIFDDAIAEIAAEEDE